MCVCVAHHTVVQSQTYRGECLFAPFLAIPSSLVGLPWYNSVDRFQPNVLWGNAPQKVGPRKLATNLVACPLEVTGNGAFKEEFVTAGGVDLKEIDMKNMESKNVPGLFFCGKVINVDGVTGGYNFMNEWSTGFVAGNEAVDYCQSGAVVN